MIQGHGIHERVPRACRFVMVLQFAFTLGLAYLVATLHAKLSGIRSTSSGSS